MLGKKILLTEDDLRDHPGYGIGDVVEDRPCRIVPGTLITEDYRRQNAAMHAKGNYGVSGAKWAPDVAMLMGMSGAKTLLDYGSGGHGLLKRQLMLEFPESQFDIREYDPAVIELNKPPQPAEIVACTDVLEHIEPECLDEVIDHIAALVQKAAFLVVATIPASKHLPDGRNAHLIIKPAWWWLRIFADHWRINLMREKPGHFHCICVPR